MYDLFTSYLVTPIHQMEQGQVEKITGHRWNDVVEEYRVVLAGSNVETWEPASSLSNCENLIRDFQESRMVEPIYEFGTMPQLDMEPQPQPQPPDPATPKVADRFFLSPEPLPEVGNEVKMSVHKGDPIYIGAHEEVTFFREGRKRGNEFRANEDYASYVHDLDDVPVLVSDGPNPRQLAVYWIGENECKDPVPVDIDDAVELCPSLVSKFYLKKLSPYFHLD